MWKQFWEYLFSSRKMWKSDQICLAKDRRGDARILSNEDMVICGDMNDTSVVRVEDMREYVEGMIFGGKWG